MIFKGPMISEASPIFNHTHPIIIKATFGFPKFASAYKKSVHFTNSVFRYSTF